MKYLLKIQLRKNIHIFLSFSFLILLSSFFLVNLLKVMSDYQNTVKVINTVDQADQILYLSPTQDLAQLPEEESYRILKETKLQLLEEFPNNIDFASSICLPSHLASEKNYNNEPIPTLGDLYYIPSLAINENYLNTFEIQLDNGKQLESIGEDEIILPYSMKNKYKVGDSIQLYNTVERLDNGNYVSKDYQVVGFTTENEQYVSLCPSLENAGFQEITMPITNFTSTDNTIDTKTPEGQWYPFPYTLDSFYFLDNSSRNDFDKIVDGQYFKTINVKDNYIEILTMQYNTLFKSFINISLIFIITVCVMTILINFKVIKQKVLYSFCLYQGYKLKVISASELFILGVCTLILYCIIFTISLFKSSLTAIIPNITIIGLTFIIYGVIYYLIFRYKLTKKIINNLEEQ